MNARGRPQFKEVPMGIWVLVERMRARIGPGRSRDSVRSACDRLEKKLTKDIVGPRDLKWETFRDHYKKFEKTMRRSNSGEELARANNLLVIARKRREVLGWDVSPWLFVMEPEVLAAEGVEVILTGDKNFSIPNQMNFSPTK